MLSGLSDMTCHFVTASYVNLSTRPVFVITLAQGQYIFRQTSNSLFLLARQTSIKHNLAIEHLIYQAFNFCARAFGAHLLYPLSYTKYTLVL